MRAMGTKQEACLRNLLLDVYAQYGFKQDDPSTWVVEEETAVIMTDGHEDRLFIDVPKAEKDEAKALGARWSGGLRISEHRDRPFRLIVTAHFANA
ncbi:hypothetical protein PsexTeo8_61300 (plasmid) [Pseudomonas extremaustralis]|nr:hypothetical protein [Pseudomonas extremaustralis]